MKKIIIIVSLIVVTGVYGVMAFNSSHSVKEKINNGKLSWNGGVNDKYVYSELIDNTDDGDQWNGRVWVQNSLFRYDYVESMTNYVGVDGKIAVNIKKAWVPCVINKAGYKNISQFKDSINE